MTNKPKCVCVCVYIKVLLLPKIELCACSVLSDSGIPGTVVTRLLCPWNFPGKNTGTGAFPSPGDLPKPGIEPAAFASCALAAGFFTSWAIGEAHRDLRLLLRPWKQNEIRKTKVFKSLNNGKKGQWSQKCKGGEP